MVYSLFSCHKCTRWSHPILTFLTFHEIEFATKVPSVLFTRNIFVMWHYLLYSRCNCIHIYRVWYELFEKQIKYYTLFRVLRWEFASESTQTQTSVPINKVKIQLCLMFILFIILCFLVYTIHDGLSNFSNMSYLYSTK